MKGKKTGGRKAGTPNKVGASMRECVANTLEWLQQQPRVNMREWAVSNPDAFYAIAAKLMPTEIQATVNTTIIEFEEAS